MKKTNKEQDQEEAAHRVAEAWVAARPGCTGEVASGYYSQALAAIKGIEQGQKNVAAQAALDAAEE